ncbi:MAG TPA: hypothetical protein VMM60_18155 [Ilumatobacter sp.]|nr:hypothetical protein [Ilumatobacter sp.]
MSETTGEYVDTVPPWGSPGHGAAIGELGMQYDYDGDQLVGVGEITEERARPTRRRIEHQPAVSRSVVNGVRDRDTDAEVVRFSR